MMTSTERYAAASDIARSINRDLDNNPNFTMTRDQLRARIDTYLDCPHTNDDARRIFTRLIFDPALPLRDRNPSSNL
jgi:hypothetical protein